MVIFHSHVNLPEGIRQPKKGWSQEFWLERHHHWIEGKVCMEPCFWINILGCSMGSYKSSSLQQEWTMESMKNPHIFWTYSNNLSWLTMPAILVRNQLSESESKIPLWFDGQNLLQEINSSGSVVGPAVDPTKFWRAVSTCLKNMRVHASHDLGYLPSPWPPQQPPAFVIRDVDVADLCLSRLVIGHFHGEASDEKGSIVSGNRQ